MRVVVVGGGLTGVSSAFELALRGHEVELFEAGEELAAQTSFANGGVITPGMCEPWNTPGVWRDLIASFFDSGSPMKLHLDAIPGLAMWGLQFLAQSSTRRFNANTRASFALCQYSLEHTTRWVVEHGLACHYRSSATMDSEVPTGNMKIFPDRQSSTFSMQLLELLKPLGLQAERLSADAVLDKEPALAAIRHKIDCGLYFPADTSGDARLFTRAVGAKLLDAGGRVHLNQRVEALLGDSKQVRGVVVNGQPVEADAVVVAAANASPELLAPLALHLPIKPVKGYSLTIDISHVDSRPRIPVINQAMHAVLNPLGKSLRVAGTAEFTRRQDTSLGRARIDNMKTLVRGTYPDIAAQLGDEHIQPWCGFRPMTPDGKPYMGSSGVKGLYINAGHGYLGWTQAVGSALVLADILESKAPAIDGSLFSVNR